MRRTPMVRAELTNFEKMLWTNVVWCYISAWLINPVFLLLPVIGIFFGIVPCEPCVPCSLFSPITWDVLWLLVVPGGHRGRC